MGEREGQGTAFESLAPRSAVSKPAACAAAKSFGVPAKEGEAELLQINHSGKMVGSAGLEPATSCL